MSAGSPASVESRKPLDPEQDESTGALPHGKPEPIPGLRREGIEQRRLCRDRHQFHGAHPEPRDGVVAHDDQIRSGPGDENAPHLVGCGAEDGAPDADREGGKEQDEQDSDERA